MRCLTLTQPWASLVVAGVKRIETRSWSTPHRGRLAIHAAKGWRLDDRAFARQVCGRLLPGLRPDDLPRGVVLGTVELLDVVSTASLSPSMSERFLGDFGVGRFGWLLVDPVAFDEPVPASGRLGLWEWEDPRG